MIACPPRTLGGSGSGAAAGREVGRPGGNREVPGRSPGSLGVVHDNLDLHQRTLGQCSHLRRHESLLNLQLANTRPLGEASSKTTIQVGSSAQHAASSRACIQQSIKRDISMGSTRRTCTQDRAGLCAPKYALYLVWVLSHGVHCAQRQGKGCSQAVDVGMRTCVYLLAQHGARRVTLSID